MYELDKRRYENGARLLQLKVKFEFLISVINGLPVECGIKSSGTKMEIGFFKGCQLSSKGRKTA